MISFELFSLETVSSVRRPRFALKRHLVTNKSGVMLLDLLLLTKPQMLKYLSMLALVDGIVFKSRKSLAMWGIAPEFCSQKAVDDLILLMFSKLFWLMKVLNLSISAVNPSFWRAVARLTPWSAKKPAKNWSDPAVDGVPGFVASDVGRSFVGYWSTASCGSAVVALPNNSRSPTVLMASIPRVKRPSDQVVVTHHFSPFTLRTDAACFKETLVLIKSRLN